MKKIVFILSIVSMFLYSCSPKVAKVVSATEPGPVTPHFVILPATFSGFLSGNQEIRGPVLKQELEGAIVSFMGSFTITPETNYEINTEHQKGGVLRNVKIEGDDPCNFITPNGLIEGAFFSGNKKVPDSLHISLVSEDSTKYCLTMILSNNGDYIPKVVYKIVKDKVYSNLVRVYVVEGGEKHFFKFKRTDGSLMENYPLSKLPSRFFENGKLRPEYKVQRIPIMVKDKKTGKLYQKITTKKVYSKDEAGYKFTSPCGRTCYLSNKNITLKNIWVKQIIEDNRIEGESSGFLNPNE